MAKRQAVIEAMHFPVLIGDIGGTNARFAVIPDPAAEPLIFPPLATGDFSDVESAIEAGVFAATHLRPRSAIFDLAGPIVGEAVAITNAAWVIRPPAQTIPRLKLNEVILLNDFEALAMALTALPATGLASIGGEWRQAQGAKVVIGPGTGLGVGALVEAEGVAVPVPGEGGHVALGPAEPDEFPLWQHIEPEKGRISAETLLSGRGLVGLYRAVAKTNGGEPRPITPAEVTQAALAGSDALAVRTVNLYCRLLGRVAGDMALIFMAHGGVYVGGGIPPRILPFLRQGEFRRAFEKKAPHQAVIATMPTFVIVHDNPALIGLAAFARTPERFGVTLTRRRWRKA